MMTKGEEGFKRNWFCRYKDPSETKQHTVRSLLILLLAVLWTCMFPIHAGAETVSVIVSPQFQQTEARSMLNRVNAFRKSADAWYWNSDNITKTVCSSLSDLTYDYELEKIAMQRAAEIALSYSHYRPDSGLCFNVYPEMGYSYISAGENIAAGYSDEKSVFDGWREDRAMYGGQGHRRTILSSSYNRIGIGHVYFKGVHYWVQEFAASYGAVFPTPAVDSVCDVAVVINPAKITSITATPAQSSVSVSYPESALMPEVTWGIRLNSCWGYSGTAPVTLQSQPSWQISDPSVVDLSGNVISSLKAGSTSAVMTAFGTSCTVTLTVLPASVGNAVIHLAEFSFEYDGSAHLPEVTSVTVNGRNLTACKDYSISYKNNINAGEAQVEITGCNNYTGIASKSFTIVPKCISGCRIDPIPDQTYTGSEIVPQINVNLNGIKLTEADYTVSATTNINVGTAFLTVSGKGNYQGAEYASFEIQPANIGNGIIFTIPAQVYTGSPITLSDPGLYVNQRKLIPGVDYDAVYSNNTEVGTAGILLSGKDNYYGSFAATFEIRQLLPLGSRVNDTKNGNAYQVTVSDPYITPEVQYAGTEGNKTDIKIPDTVQLDGLTYKVTSVAPSALKNRRKLKAVTIGKKVKTIGQCAFEGCTSLRTVNGGTDLVTIGEKAFFKCTALKSITIPSKVERIGGRAFYGCKKLKRITIKTKLLTSSCIGKKAFSGTPAKTVVKVPAKQLKNYRKLMVKKGISKKATIKK